MEEPDEEDDYEEGDYEACFVDCTCDHDQDDHGWGCCEVEDCPCEGGWEE